MDFDEKCDSGEGYKCVYVTSKPWPYQKVSVDKQWRPLATTDDTVRRASTRVTNYSL